MSGKVTFLGAGPGPADLITVRGLRALEKADVVLYDHLVDKALLRGLRARLVDVGKHSGWHRVPQEQINTMLVALARGGENVVRLKGGDPAVFGRVGEEALACVEHGIEVEWVPGVTSAIAAPAFAGIPVTHRGVADSFCVVTAHRRNDELDFAIPPFHSRMTVVLLMGVGTLAEWIAVLRREGYPEDWPLAFVERGACVDQRVLKTTVGEAVAAAENFELKSPAVAVVGQVVTLHEVLAWQRDTDASTQRPALRVAGGPSSVRAAEVRSARRERVN